MAQVMLKGKQCQLWLWQMGLVSRLHHFLYAILQRGSLILQTKEGNQTFKEKVTLALQPRGY